MNLTAHFFPNRVQDRLAKSSGARMKYMDEDDNYSCIAGRPPTKGFLIVASPSSRIPCHVSLGSFVFDIDPSHLCPCEIQARRKWCLPLALRTYGGNFMSLFGIFFFFEAAWGEYGQTYWIEVFPLILVELLLELEQENYAMPG